MKAILSIKPEFVEKIFEGKKKYEFRRTIFKKFQVNKIVIYASSPISRVVGEFDVSDIYLDDINNLWDRTKDYSGVEKDYFLKYFSNKKIGFAICIKSFKKYDKPFCISELGKKPPQSFIYLN